MNEMTCQRSHSGCMAEPEEVKLERWFRTDREGSGSLGKEAYSFPCGHGEKLAAWC